MLHHASENTLAAFGAEIRQYGEMRQHDGARGGGGSEPLITSVHLALIGLAPMSTALEATTAAAREQHAAGRPCAVGEPRERSAAALAPRSSSAATCHARR